MHPMNVMIVDDEEWIRHGLQKILSRMELEVTVVASCGNGMEAVTELSAMRPGDVEVLITDIKMPVMDGLKLIEWVRGKLPDVQVIVLSGFSDFEYARKAMRFMVKDYLLKPVDKYELFD